MDNETALLIVLAIIGALLIGKGITGYAIISQTCCFSGEDCNPEEMCDAIKPELQNPIGVNPLSVASGIILIIISLAALHKHIHDIHKKK
ncbi:hypothetical protein KY331_02760 [Candidatus Woesearchaeota archaeon]|nr:hypothetical protein [Candidatus Woesearchaeota archaeon]